MKNFSERPALKWFKDDLNIIQPREIDKNEDKDKSIVIEELKEELIVEEKFQKNAEENTKKELIIEDKLKKDLIIKENTNKHLIIEKSLKQKSIIKGKLKEELNIERNSEKVSTIKENLKTKSIVQTNLKEGTSLNENIGKEADIKKTTTILSNNKSDINFEDCSSCSEDSESNDEITLSKLSTNSLIKEIDQKSSQKFYRKMKKQRPDRDLIDRILKGQYPKINQIFDEPTKAVPLPRKSGTINVTFSERAFPTPARESAFLEEQEVRVSLIINFTINIFLLRILRK